MKQPGRTVAAMLLLQGACAPLMNFALLQPMLAAPGFLANGAAHSGKFGLAILLGLAMGAMNIGIALAAWPVLRPRAERHAVALLAASIAAFVLLAVEMTGVLSMASLARAHAAATGADADRLAALAPLVTTWRASAHFIALMAGCVTAFVLYLATFRLTLVPRWLAGIGMLAALLALFAAATPLFGGRVPLAMMAPLGLVHLVLAGWLLWRGFADPAGERA